MTLTYILCDLDRTVYPLDSTIFAEINRRMSRFVADLLRVDLAEADRLRAGRLPKYGSTLGWLLQEHDLGDPEEFLSYTHPTDVGRYMDPDPAVASALESIDLPKSILTNSPMEHALRVLRYLGLEQHFERVFDLRYNEYTGKPSQTTYHMVLDDIGRAPPEVLFIDDSPLYARGFRDIGGQVLLVSNDGEAPDLPRIASLTELPAYLGVETPDT